MTTQQQKAAAQLDRLIDRLENWRDRWGDRLGTELTDPDGMITRAHAGMLETSMALGAQGK